MSAWADGFLKRYRAMDRGLVEAGFPATSPWWFEQIARFMRAARRRWIVRAGRRAGKSSTLARVAVAWALWGAWSVPPGDAAVIPFVSVNKDEATARIRTIAAVLKTLGVEFEQRTEELEFKNERGATVLFKVFACTSSAVVGFTSIACFGDEVARWEARDTGANPAREVVGSLAPTMATQPSAFMVLSSSPWSLDDFHAESFDAGETAHQCVSYAPTWVANPTISEEASHALEPDDRTWRREYLAEPSHSVAAAFEADDVLACFGRQPRGNVRSEGWIALDPSSLRGDGFGFLIGSTTDQDELVIGAASEFDSHTPLREIVRQLSGAAQQLNTSVIYSDQREEAALRVLFEEYSISLQTYAWTEGSKHEAVSIVKRWMHERRVIVTVGDEADGGSRLRRELLAVKARNLPSGRVQYTTSGLDVASCLLTLAHAAHARAFTFASSNPLFEALQKQAEARASGPGTTRSVYGAAPFYGVDFDVLARSRAGWA